MEPDQAVDRAAASLRAARFAAGLCVLSLAVILLVLVIDNQIKRRLMADVAGARADVAEARAIVDQFTVRARDYGRAQAEPARSAPVTGSDSDISMGDPAPGGPDDDTDAGGAAWPVRDGGLGLAGGPLGDG